MKRKLTALATCLLSSCAFASAYGADIYGRGSTKDAPGIFVADPATSHSWTQVFVGLGGACETGTTELNAEENGFTFLNFKGIGSSGCSVAPYIGADYQIPNSRIVLGIEGEYRWSNDETSLSLFDGKFHGQANFDTSFLVSGRAGVLVTNDTLLFGRLGWGQADGSWEASLNGGEEAHRISGDLPTFDVLAYGGGIEARFMDGQASVRVEYRHLDYSEETVASGVTINPQIDMGLVGITYRFGQ